MKITPAKDYKKPRYAIGISAAIMALSVTGCTNPFGKKEPDLAGATAKKTPITHLKPHLQARLQLKTKNPF